MPTGYTAGIIDGKTETFQDFAKQCMRNFGACIHMRDENMDKEYEPRTPSDYHTKALEKAKEKLKQAETLTDAELIEMRTKELEESKMYHLESIAKTKIARAKLEEFLAKAIEFKAPTPEHEGLRKFMIEQLQSTIDFDGKTDYHDKALPQVEMELKNIDANQIRFSMIADANKDITYHLKNHKEELKRCADSNAWVETLLGSLACV
jgi:phenylalanyl-tRNA synthetase alpha subunit